MDSIQVFRQITIKQIVTEQSKKEAIAQLQEEIKQLTAEQQAFEADKTKILTEASLKGADAAQIAKFRQHFETDGAHFHVRQDELRLQGEAVGNMQVGEEVVIGSVEGPYELKVGQALSEALGSAIIIKDGIIKEIRD